MSNWMSKIVSAISPSRPAAPRAASNAAPVPAEAPPPSGDLVERRAALERLLGAAPAPVGSWEDTAPLTLPPDLERADCR